MKKYEQSLSLKNVDDLFTNQETRIDETREKVIEVKLEELYPFKNHPFKVVNDELMENTIASIKEYGVLSPAVVRERSEGGYELISGHRRHKASELLGLDTLPVIVRQLSDEEATIVMVDSNIQRETILPSEKAFAYKLKLEAIKRQGSRTDLTSGQVGQKLNTREIVANGTGESERQIQRYIRLTELNSDLLDMVDNKRIALNPAVEISYLSKDEQKDLLEIIDLYQATPSLSQAQRMKRFSQEGKCNIDVISGILSEEKRVEKDKIILSTDELSKYFPKSYTPRKMEETILQLVESWARKRAQNKER